MNSNRPTGGRRHVGVNRAGLVARAESWRERRSGGTVRWIGEGVGSIGTRIG